METNDNTSPGPEVSLEKADSNRIDEEG